MICLNGLDDSRLSLLVVARSQTFGTREKHECLTISRLLPSFLLAMTGMLISPPKTLANLLYLPMHYEKQ